MANTSLVAILLLCAVANVGGVTVNPIRKVVTMLQNMQKKIAAEGEKKEKMFDQYMCYCNNADGTLGKSISDAETKIPQVESSIKDAQQRKSSSRPTSKRPRQAVLRPRTPSRKQLQSATRNRRHLIK